MAEIDTSDQLMEQPGCICFCHACMLVDSLVPINVISQVSALSILAHNGKMVSRQENFSELYDVWVVKAKALIQHLARHYLHTAKAQ